MKKTKRTSTTGIQTDKGLIVVTGGAGYLGSVLVPLLLERGYRVRVVDRFFFGREPLAEIADRCELIEADTRWCPEEVFTDAYAVLDLAALANDPLGELNPERTRNINFHARVRTATAAKKAGVKRYVLASSCSVYGFQNGLLDESTPVFPVTTYAQANVSAEASVLALTGHVFCVTALRQGTLYGLSPRMRFDLVVNVMTLSIYRNHTILVRGGEQWRPLLHVADSAAAFLCVLEAPATIVSGEIFNVGATEQNFTVADIATQVHAAANMGEITHDASALDFRSYRVSSDKIHSLLGFVPRHTPRDGVKEILHRLQAGMLVENICMRTLDWYKHLLASDSDILDRTFETGPSM